MRLLTHNLLACHSRHCTQTSNNFPLRFENVKLELMETEFNDGFLRGFLPKIEWDALVQTAAALGDTSLPAASPLAAVEDANEAPMLGDELLHALHRVLLEIHVVEGQMVCPNCAHAYPIRNGIPNMLLAEHEIPR